jgi:predicted 3-demethylubiquinone-9 3-methyltransferase (glyoxalase superfamily)
MGKITNFLLFDGKAEEAMRFYTCLFRDSEISSFSLYDDPGTELSGKIKQGRFKLKGQEFLCMDNNSKPDYAFTPALSLFVSCDEEEELDTYFEGLSKEGKIYIPLGSYPFSKKFAWVEDKYGLSWQLHWGKITI